jgi:pimeloyl-ACP methyl ester carboxylesterase
VLIHGFGDTGDMWWPMAAENDHDVVVPDLRGMGLTSHPHVTSFCYSFRR